MACISIYGMSFGEWLGTDTRSMECALVSGSVQIREDSHEAAIGKLYGS